MSNIKHFGSRAVSGVRVTSRRQNHAARRPRLSVKRAVRIGLSAAMVAVTTSSLAIISPAYALDFSPRGVDVASHQHPFGARVDWRAVRLSGYSFAFIKATEGTGYINPYFRENRNEAHKNAMIVGSYHYARPNQDPIRQALHYADTIECQKRPLEFPPVLDLEETGGLSPFLLQGWTAVFLSTLNVRCATNTMIYTYPWFWRTAMRNTRLFSFSPLWIADYNGGSGPTTPLPGGWLRWSVWQYTSSGRVPGVATAVDLNKFNGGYIGLAAFSARQETVPTVPTYYAKGAWRITPDYRAHAWKQVKKHQRPSPVMQKTGISVQQAQRSVHSRP